MTVSFSTDRKVAAPTTITVTLGTDTDANTADATLTGAGTDVTFGIELVANSGDFVTGTNTFLFNPADVAKRIRFFFVDDNLNEDTEYFTLTASGGGLTRTMRYAIIDNDPLTITLSGGSDVPLDEEEFGTPEAPGTDQMVVQLDFSGGTLSRELRVPLIVYQNPDTPNAGTIHLRFGGFQTTIISGAEDWVRQPSNPFIRAQNTPAFNFAAGTTSGRISIPVINNNRNEPEETILVEIDGGVAGITGAGGVPTVVGASQTWIIGRSDPLTAVISAVTPTVLEGDMAEFQVLLTGGLATVGTVLTYDITGSATAGASADYTDSNAGTLRIPSGANTGTVVISVHSDRSEETAETITVMLTDVQSPGDDYLVDIGTANMATVTIGENSAVANTIRVVGPDEVEEGDNLDYTVILRTPQTQPLMSPITVNWSVTTNGVSGNPAESSDLSSQQMGAVEFPMGATNGSDQAEQAISLRIINDEEFERAEEFSVVVSLAGDPADTELLQSSVDTTIAASDAVQVGVYIITAAQPGVSESGLEASRQPFRLAAGAYVGRAGLPTEGDFTVTWEVFGSGANPADIRTDITGFGTVVQRGDTEVRRFTDTIAWSAVRSATFPDSVFDSLGTSFQAIIITSVNALTIVDDDLNESDETMTLRIVSVGGLTAPGEAGAVEIFDSASETTVTILSSDLISASIDAPASVGEGETALFTITLDHASAGVVTVPYTVTGDAMLPGVTTIGQITIAVGDTTGEIALMIPADRTQGDGESATLTVTFGEATVATPGRGPVTISSPSVDVTVNYSDPAHIFHVLANDGGGTVAEGATAAYTVTLTGPAPAAGTSVTVGWIISGNGVDDRDYVVSGVGADGRLSFTAPGSQTITVDIEPDGLNESTEIFVLNLTDAQPAAIADILPGGGVASVNVEDGDPLVITMSGGRRLNEEELGPTTMPSMTQAVVRLDFGATLTRVLTVPIVVHRDGDPDTFDPFSGSQRFNGGFGVIASWAGESGNTYLRPFRNDAVFQFAAGTNVGTIPIPAHDNNFNEPDEVFAASIGRGSSGVSIDPNEPYNITGAHGDFTVAVDSQTWTIAANDELTASIAAQTQTVSEGATASFVVTLAGARPRTNTVLTYVIGGDVDAGDDYTDPGAGTVTISIEGIFSTFLREVNTATLAIPVRSDRMQEAAETMTVMLMDVQSPGDDYLISIGTTATATVTIPENSTASRIISAAGPDEVAEGTTPAYTLTLRILNSESLVSDITVDWSITTDGVSGNPAELSDFSTSAGTVVFPAGTTNGSDEAVQSIGLGIVADGEFERDEEFSVILTLASPDSDTEVRQSSVDATITGPNDAAQLGVSPASQSGVNEGELGSNRQPFRLAAGAYEGRAGLPTEGDFTVTGEVFGSGANPADIRTDITGFGTVVQRGDTEVRQFTDTIAWSTVRSANLPTAVFLSLGPSFEGIVITSVNALTIVDDDLNESTETMTLRILSVDGLEATGEMGAMEIFDSASETSVAIIDNDAITVAIAAPATAVERQTAHFTVTLAKASAGAVTVPYTVGGTAMATDANNGEITIPAGETTGQIALMIPGDRTLGEGANRTLTVTLENVTVAAPGRGPVTISGGDAADVTVDYIDTPHLFAVSVDESERIEGESAEFTVTLTGRMPAAGTSVTVAWEIGGENVDGDDDYALSGADTDGRLSFTATGSQTITVAIEADGLNESTETLIFTLTDASPTAIADILTASASVAIAQSDPLRITMGGGETLNEEFLGVEAMADGAVEIPPMPGTGAGVVQLDFGATLTRELRIPVSIYQDGDLNTFDPVFIGRAFSLGTGWSPALRPAYGRPQVASTLFNFATGTSAGQIPVPAYNDDPPINEREEAFAMVIDTVTGAHGVPTVVVDSQTWIIEASDPLTAVIAAPTQTALEGDMAEFTVTLAGAAASVDTVLTYTIGGDVVAGDDYTGRSTGTVTFPGDTSRANPVHTLAIPVRSDSMLEATETMTVRLTGVQSPGDDYLIDIGTTNTAAVTIPANTTVSRIITAAGPDEVEEGGVSTYTLTLRIPQSQPLRTTITVNWNVTTDVASANPAELPDFSASAGTVEFPVGTVNGSAEARQSIALGIVDDSEFEGAEEFSVSLTHANPDLDTEVRQSRLDTTITTSDAVEVVVFHSAASRPENWPSPPFGFNSFVHADQSGLPTEGSFTVTWEIVGTGDNPADMDTDIRGAGTVTAIGGTRTRHETETILWSSIANPVGTDPRRFVESTTVGALRFVDDNLNESNEMMTISLVGVGGLDAPGEAGAVEIGTSQASITIADNDAITASIAPATLGIEEGEMAELTVILDKASQDDVSVSYTVTAGGTFAPPYSDDTGGALTVAAGSTSAIVRIASSQTDDIGTGTGTLTVAFGTVATGDQGGAISSAGMAVVTVTFIAFDDNPPMLEGLAWAPGQETLWLKTDEPFKVLAHPDEPMASSDTASLSGMDVLTAGDFMVLENYVMGMARATTLSVTEVDVMPQNQGLELRLERGLAAAAAPLYLRYQHTAGTPAIYDTAFEQGSYDPDMGRNHLASQGPFILRQTGAVGSNGDSDGDGLPDVVEIAIGENPLVAVASTRQPAFSIRSAGTESAPFYIAYSGIRRYGVREHLGALSVASTMQTAAASIQAYYRSGDFGYDGGEYGCASGAFPANYMAPLSEGGCEPVNWGNIRVGQTYEIAWLARSADGVWAVNTAMESNLPEQWIQRIPELNMTSERVFTTGISVTVLAESDDGRSFMTMTSTAGVVEIADLSGIGSLSLWSPSTMTPAGSGHDSLGLSTQTTVVLVGSAVPPLLGRAVLRRGSSEVNVLAEGESGYTLSIPVENSAGIGGLSATSSSVSEASGVLSSITGAPDAARGSYEVTMTVNAGVAATTDRAVIRVTIAGMRGGETVSSYRYPVVAADAPLAAQRTDSDGDGIADDYDHYDAVAHLPVTVDEGAGGKSWHHIRPVLSEHDLRLGESTFERLGGLEESLVDEYADYAASRTTDVGNLSAVYDFEISGVDYAGVTEAGGVGGAAGVIIPLPADLHNVGAVTLVKYPSGRLFSTTGENGYGFAPLAEGACPDDTMGAGGSPYRETKSVGDACMVVYIVDGGANDEDGTVNGVIRDPLGIRSGASGGGNRHHGGAFSPAGLAALLLLLALYSRRRRAA